MRLWLKAITKVIAEGRLYLLALGIFVGAAAGLTFMLNLILTHLPPTVTGAILLIALAAAVITLIWAAASSFVKKVKEMHRRLKAREEAEKVLHRYYDSSNDADIRRL